MSVNPDGMDTIDYSDFEYQQINHEHAHSNLTGSPARTRILTDYEVLGGIGGLDNNEVAELVWAELVITAAHDQEENDLDVGSETNWKGSFGANLPSTDELLPGNGSAPAADIVFEQNADASNTGGSQSEDRIFAQYRYSKNPAFDDQTNGPGGAGGANSLVIQRPFRNMTGRGPVLDSSDSISVLTELDQADEIVPATGTVDIHCVWDVAETSDAGRAFSVPTM